MVINENGDAAGDFRVESDTEDKMIYLDANGDTDGALYLGGSTNGIKINKGGELTLIGTATVWEDLRVEPITRTTGTKAPIFANWFGGIYDSRSLQNALWNKQRLANRAHNTSLATGRVNGQVIHHGDKR